MKRLLPLFFALLFTNASFGQQPLPLLPDMQAWYPMCGNANDYSPGGLYSLIPSGTVALTTDRFNQGADAYKFDGTTSSLSFTAPFFSSAAFLTTDFTYACWINAAAAQSSVIWYNGNPAMNGYGIYMNNGTLGTPGANVEIVFGAGVGAYLSTPITLNRWHQLVLTKSGGAYRFYVDGAAAAPVGFFIPVSPFTLPTSGQFTIGQDYNTVGTSAFNGDVDDVAIYNTALSASQITQLYNFNPDVDSFTLGGDTSICANTILLQPSISFDTSFRYVWSTGETTATVTETPPVAPGGYYTLTVKKPYGCDFFATRHVTHFAATVNIGPRDTTFCVGGAAILNPSPNPIENYLWSTGDTTGSITVSTSGTYWVRVDSANGCSGTDTITVTVDPPVFVNLGPDSSSCAGAPITLQSTYTYTGVTYQWGWTSLAGIPGITTNPTYAASVTGTYWLTVTKGACFGSDTETVNVSYDTLHLISPDTSICKGTSVQVRASGNPFAVNEWTPTAGVSSVLSFNPLITPDTSAWYRIISNINGCTVRDSFYIDVQPKPTVYIGGNRSVCKGDTIHITAIVTPQWYHHYIYSWTPGTYLDHSVTTATDSALGTVVFTAGDSTDLIITVKTPADNGTTLLCRSVDSAEIIVHTPKKTSLRDTVVCPGDSVILNPNPVTGDSYAWHPGTYLDDSTAVRPVATPINTLSYWTRSTDIFGCNDTMTENIAVFPGAVIDLGDSVTLYPGESYQISPQTNCTSFTWSPPIGLNDTLISNPIASPVVNTKYIVKATTEWGCKTSDSINIHINPLSVIAMPNAFTPGNGPNNILYVLKRGIASLHYYRIYNRWGQKVFETSNIDEGWDGTFKGKPQPFDVYIYDVEAITDKGVIFDKTGNVTLLR